MTDEEIAKLVDDNTEELWSGTRGIRKEKALNMMKRAINSQAAAIAEKDAKIYAYEAIIANSNFKAVLPKKGLE